MGFYLNKVNYSYDLNMKTLTLLIVVLSVAYVRPAAVDQPAVPEVSPEVSPDDWSAYFEKIRALAENKGAEVKREIEELITEYDLEGRLTEAEEHLEGVAEEGLERAQEGIARIKAKLAEHDINVGEIWANAKERVTGYFDSFKQWALNKDWNAWKESFRQNE